MTRQTMPRQTQGSRTGRLMEDVRRMPLFRQLAPMESGIGWPIAVRHRPGWTGTTAVYMRLPLFGFQQPPDASRPTVIYPPFATITLDWATGRPVEYADLRYTRPWAMHGPQGAVGEFPHDAIRGWSAGEYLKSRTRLLELYDVMLDDLRAERPFGERAEFGELFQTLLDPSLEPYYRALGGRFVEQFLGPGSSAADVPAQ